MMVLFDDDRDGGDDGTSTFWYETAINEVLENSILFKKCNYGQLLFSALFLVRRRVAGCQRAEAVRGIPEVSQFRSRGTTFSMKFYSEVSQKYPKYPKGIPPGITVSLQRNFKKYFCSITF